MVKLAKKLKKNNVAVDVVAFGDGIEEGGERGVLKAFVEGASSGDNSCVLHCLLSIECLRFHLHFVNRHLVSIPPGPHLLSDILISSPILAGDRGMGIPDEAMGDAGGAGGSGAAGGDGFEFGVDPSLDPELAMVRYLTLLIKSSTANSCLTILFGGRFFVCLWRRNKHDKLPKNKLVELPLLPLLHLLHLQPPQQRQHPPPPLPLSQRLSPS
jgi:hypothetical protein